MKWVAIVSGSLLILLILAFLDPTSFVDYRLPADEFYQRVLIFFTLLTVTVTVFVMSCVALIVKKVTTRAR